MSPASQPIALLALRPGEGALRRIQAECTARLLDGSPAPGAAIEGLQEAEGLLCTNRLPLDAELLGRAPKLRVISLFGVGFDNVDVEEATRRGVAICNTPGVLTDAVADLTMALILGLSRRLVENATFVAEGGWAGGEDAPPLGVDVRGKTLGLIGFGRIGRAVASRAGAFGMRVSFYDSVRRPGDEASCPYRELDDLLRESDFVSVHVNLTPGTRHLIGARELDLMMPSAYLVNTARGQVVDQDALAAALRGGAIAGAALDVLETEPPRADEAILSVPNVLILPHVGSATRETRGAMLNLAIDNLLAVLRGDPPAACVNPDALEEATRR